MLFISLLVGQDHYFPVNTYSRIILHENNVAEILVPRAVLPNPILKVAICTSFRPLFHLPLLHAWVWREHRRSPCSPVSLSVPPHAMQLHPHYRPGMRPFCAVASRRRSKRFAIAFSFWQPLWAGVSDSRVARGFNTSLQRMCVRFCLCKFVCLSYILMGT